VFSGYYSDASKKARRPIGGTRFPLFAKLLLFAASMSWYLFMSRFLTGRKGVRSAQGSAYSESTPKDEQVGIRVQRSMDFAEHFAGLQYAFSSPAFIIRRQQSENSMIL